MAGRKREVASFCKGRGCVVNLEEKTTLGPLFRDVLRSFPLALGVGELPRAEEAAPPKPLPGLQPPLRPQGTVPSQATIPATQK